MFHRLRRAQLIMPLIATIIAGIAVTGAAHPLPPWTEQPGNSNVASYTDTDPLSPEPKDGPYRGQFSAAKVPIYADPPDGDGYACQFLRRCVSAKERSTQGPGPIMLSVRADQQIHALVCSRGDFTLIDFGNGQRGWTERAHVTSYEVGFKGLPVPFDCAIWQN